MPLDFQTSLGGRVPTQETGERFSLQSGVIQNPISLLLLGMVIPGIKVFWMEDGIHSFCLETSGALDLEVKKKIS